MLVNMLKAVSKILEMNEASIERIGCAKVIIDELIAGLEKKEIVPSFTEDDIEPLLHNRPPVKPVKDKNPARDENGYEGIVENGILKEIKNLPLEAKIKFNGQIMTHQEAKGKQLKELEIL